MNSKQGSTPRSIPTPREFLFQKHQNSLIGSYTGTEPPGGPTNRSLSFSPKNGIHDTIALDSSPTHHHHDMYSSDSQKIQPSSSYHSSGSSPPIRQFGLTTDKQYANGNGSSPSLRTSTPILSSLSPSSPSHVRGGVVQQQQQHTEGGVNTVSSVTQHAQDSTSTDGSFDRDSSLLLLANTLDYHASNNRLEDHIDHILARLDLTTGGNHDNHDNHGVDGHNAAHTGIRSTPITSTPTSILPTTTRSNKTQHRLYTMLMHLLYFNVLYPLRATPLLQDSATLIKAIEKSLHSLHSAQGPSDPSSGSPANEDSGGAGGNGGGDDDAIDGYHNQHQQQQQQQISPLLDILNSVVGESGTQSALGSSYHQQHHHYHDHEQYTPELSYLFSHLVDTLHNNMDKSSDSDLLDVVKESAATQKPQPQHHQQQQQQQQQGTSSSAVDHRTALILDDLRNASSRIVGSGDQDVQCHDVQDHDDLRHHGYNGQGSGEVEGLLSEDKLAHIADYKSITHHLLRRVLLLRHILMKSTSERQQFIQLLLSLHQKVIHYRLYGRELKKQLQNVFKQRITLESELQRHKFHHQLQEPSGVIITPITAQHSSLHSNDLSHHHHHHHVSEQSTVNSSYQNSVGHSSDGTESLRSSSSFVSSYGGGGGGGGPTASVVSSYQHQQQQPHTLFGQSSSSHTTTSYNLPWFKVDSKSSTERTYQHVMSIVKQLDQQRQSQIYHENETNETIARLSTMLSTYNSKIEVLSSRNIELQSDNQSIQSEVEYWKQRALAAEKQHQQHCEIVLDHEHHRSIVLDKLSTVISKHTSLQDRYRQLIPMLSSHLHGENAHTGTPRARDSSPDAWVDGDNHTNQLSRQQPLQRADSEASEGSDAAGAIDAVISAPLDTIAVDIECCLCQNVLQTHVPLTYSHLLALDPVHLETALYAHGYADAEANIDLERLDALDQTGSQSNGKMVDKSHGYSHPHSPVGSSNSNPARSPPQSPPQSPRSSSQLQYGGSSRSPTPSAPSSPIAANKSMNGGGGGNVDDSDVFHPSKTYHHQILQDIQSIRILGEAFCRSLRNTRLSSQINDNNYNGYDSDDGDNESTPAIPSHTLSPVDLATLTGNALQYVRRMFTSYDIGNNSGNGPLGIPGTPSLLSPAMSLPFPHSLSRQSNDHHHHSRGMPSPAVSIALIYTLLPRMIAALTPSITPSISPLGTAFLWDHHKQNVFHDQLSDDLLQLHELSLSSLPLQQLGYLCTLTSQVELLNRCVLLQQQNPQESDTGDDNPTRTDDSMYLLDHTGSETTTVIVTVPSTCLLQIHEQQQLNEGSSSSVSSSIPIISIIEKVSGIRLDLLPSHFTIERAQQPPLSVLTESYQIQPFDLISSSTIPDPLLSYNRQHRHHRFKSPTITGSEQFNITPKTHRNRDNSNMLSPISPKTHVKSPKSSPYDSQFVLNIHEGAVSIVNQLIALGILPNDQQGSSPRNRNPISRTSIPPPSPSSQGASAFGQLMTSEEHLTAHMTTNTILQHTFGLSLVFQCASPSQCDYILSLLQPL